MEARGEQLSLPVGSLAFRLPLFARRSHLKQCRNSLHGHIGALLPVLVRDRAAGGKEGCVSLRREES